MKIIIHRGINQIGGCITEIATDNAKIIIDLGHNLPNGEQDIYTFSFNNQKLLSWMSDRGFCMPIRLSSLKLVKALLKKLVRMRLY